MPIHTEKGLTFIFSFAGLMQGTDFLNLKVSIPQDKTKAGESRLGFLLLSSALCWSGTAAMSVRMP